MVCNISNTLRFCGPTHQVDYQSICMWKYRRGRLASHFAYAPCPVFESVFFARHPLITQHVSRLWTLQIMKKSCQVGARTSGAYPYQHDCQKRTRTPEEATIPAHLLAEKTALGLDRAMTSSTIVASSPQPLNTVMQQSTDWLGTLSLLSWLLSDRFWRGMARFDGKMKANSATTLH